MSPSKVKGNQNWQGGAKIPRGVTVAKSDDGSADAVIFEPLENR